MVKVIHFGVYTAEAATAISTHSDAYALPSALPARLAGASSNFEYINKVLNLYENEGWQVITAAGGHGHELNVTLRK
ncbi:MAG: hypothetical protein LBS74_09825 [Oscillospiraceae bacterium]|nr:hypothetical protein [Oscillospiraceae bacterium]